MLQEITQKRGGKALNKKLKTMMEQLIQGNYNCNDFSYDFPNELLEVEDTEALRMLDDMPEICAAYDPYKTDEEDLLNDKEFIEKVKQVYEKFTLA